MFWKIIRPQIWVFDRKLRDTNRFIIVGTILVVLYGGQWLYNNYIYDKLALLNSDQAVTLIASFLPLSLVVLVMSAALGVGDIMHQLYLASDLELLMVAPVSNRTIFLVKLYQCSRATVIPAFLLGALLLAVGVARQAALIYFVLVLGLILMGMILATALVMGIVILLARLLPPQRVRWLMAVSLALLPLALLLGQQSLIKWVMAQSELLTRLSTAFLDIGRLAGIVAGFGAAALGVMFASYQIFNKAFYGGWNRLHVVPGRPAAKRPAARRSAWLVQWSRPLPAPLRSIVFKEWLVLWRDPRRLIGSLMTPLLMIVFVWPFYRLNVMLRPLVFWLLLVYGLLFQMNAMIDALTAVGREGRQIALLRSLPVSMKVVLRAKFWGGAWIWAVLVWSLFSVITGLLMQFPLWQVAFLIGAVVWAVALVSAVSIAYGALVANFTVKDPAQKSVSVLHGYLAM
ncbi:MAG: hypothetical protein OEZ02_13525 [Anaerolineae bacterium]|nr:hypothetical protein [Anaerolineae bacterium]